MAVALAVEARKELVDVLGLIQSIVNKKLDEWNAAHLLANAFAELSAQIGEVFPEFLDNLLFVRDIVDAHINVSNAQI